MDRSGMVKEPLTKKRTGYYRNPYASANDLPSPNQCSVVKMSGFLHPYAARVPRDRLLALEGEGTTWKGQPSQEGIAIFQCALNFGEAQGVLDSQTRLPSVLGGIS
jgi:hypothetical protein